MQKLDARCNFNTNANFQMHNATFSLLDANEDKKIPREIQAQI